MAHIPKVDPRYSPDRPLRVVLAGAGLISGHHLTAWKELPDAVVVAICDPDRKRAMDRARAFGVDSIYTDVGRMLAEQRPDAIDIATPPDTHSELARVAAEASVHILCQKPLCPTFAEAGALATAIEGRVRLAVHENWRLRPQYQQALAWSREGQIGDVVRCRLASRSSGLIRVNDQPGPALIRQPFLAALPRLVIAELLVHHLDVARVLVGPLRVSACRIWRVSPDVIGEDAASILLEGPGGLTVEIEGNLSAPRCPPLPADTLELVGTAGSISFHDQTLSLNGVRSEVRDYDMVDAYQQSFAQAIRDFVECLRNGRPFATPVSDHLQVLRLMEDAYALAAP